MKQITLHAVGGPGPISLREKSSVPRGREDLLQTTFAFQHLLFPGSPACWPALKGFQTCQSGKSPALVETWYVGDPRDVNK